jgi:23S rRNA pseudouridine2605 synthase
MSQERVQKILAQVGIASRRKAEELITEGSVTINGKVAKLGDKAEFGKDAIKVKGKLIHTKENPVYVAFYKPRGVLSSLSDPENRPTLANYLGGIKERIYPIGRLDFNTEGLLLLTNDGAMAERVQKATNLLRVYHVKVKGRPDAAQLARLEKGARIGSRVVTPHSIRFAEELASKIVLEVAFNDPGVIDVKAFFELKGMLVDKITRTAIGQITSKGIAPGEHRLLKASQFEALLAQPELGMRRLEAERQAGGRSADGGFEYRRPSRAQEERERTRPSMEEMAAEANQPAAPRVIAVRGAAVTGPTRPLKTISRPSGIVVREKGAPGSFGDRPKKRSSYGDGSKREGGFGAFGGGGRGSDRGGGRDERPTRKPFGSRPSFGGSGDRDDRPARKPFGSRPSFGGSGDRDDRPARKPFGSRPSFGGGGDRGDRPSGGGGKTFGDKPRSGKRPAPRK